MEEEIRVNFRSSSTAKNLWPTYNYEHQCVEILKYIDKDFNAKSRCDSLEEIQERYDLGFRNERGDHLIQFCSDMGYLIKII